MSMLAQGQTIAADSLPNGCQVLPWDCGTTTTCSVTCKSGYRQPDCAAVLIGCKHCSNSNKNVVFDGMQSHSRLGCMDGLKYCRAVQHVMLHITAVLSMQPCACLNSGQKKSGRTHLCSQKADLDYCFLGPAAQAPACLLAMTAPASPDSGLQSTKLV